ncbi:asparagine synthase C-terminal domain-containing protein [Pseudomonas aeruginosa]|uniref:asparagine synthase C-terminal domain-containing protein n=1 Tax=Pseudomonas aeruginosa TaxID=287 RepID=UPI002AC33FFC|nr:asparagine synthase-related protein [Pseudomonas aeruginosa]
MGPADPAIDPAARRVRHQAAVLQLPARARPAGLRLRAAGAAAPARRRPRRRRGDRPGGRRRRAAGRPDPVPAGPSAAARRGVALRSLPGGPRLCQRQRLATAPASEADSLDEQLGETLERCRQTFRPCALLVSGGVDSNLLGSYLDPQLQRFHLCLEGDEESLLPHPRLQRFELRQEAFMPLLRRAVGNFGGATRMSSLLMYQRLADGIGEQGYHCVLLGEGADELFWGYPRHLELWRRRDAPEPRRFAAAWFGEYRRKAALLAEPAGRRVAERIEELAHEALGQGLEAAIGQFDLHYSLEPLLRRADHLLMSRTIEARTPYLHGALAQRAGRLQRIVGDTAKAPLVALLEQREKRWQAQPKRHFRLPFERWPQALGEMRRHLAERLPALHDLGLEGLDAPSVAALPGDQLFTLTTLSLWQQEYGASL